MRRSAVNEYAITEVIAALVAGILVGLGLVAVTRRLALRSGGERA